jgi:hypothetical protein
MAVNNDANYVRSRYKPIVDGVKNKSLVIIQQMK